MKRAKLSVAGSRHTLDFQKTANVFASLEHLFPNQVVADILEFDDDVGLHKWTQSTLLPLLKLSSLPPDTSAVITWIDDEKLIGGADQALGYAKSLFCSTPSPVPPPSSPSLLQFVPDQSVGPYDFDVVVIGGGSGGLAFAKRAAKVYNAKVCLLDYVKPSPFGSKWGLGGTCVNVGCIPKKLMHTASLLGEQIKHGYLTSYGFDESNESLSHSWERMVENVQGHIKSLNFGYRVALREASVKYMNKLGRVKDAHHVEAVDVAKNTVEVLSTRYILIAVGGRPKSLGIPGEELSISSDDLFSLGQSPGKTCVIGASYVALECAGFLNGLRLETTVMVRSLLLRGFDEDMAFRVGRYMEEEAGVRFLRECTPVRLERNQGSGRIVVHFQHADKSFDSEEFDTVVCAIGRDADTKGLNLAEGAGVTVDKGGKLAVNAFEQTNIPNILALGDVLLGKPELTPVAIYTGKLLADRLFGNQVTVRMDYTEVATTVFTPLEYGTIGWTEEMAIRELGADQVEVFHTNFLPLEWTVPHGKPNDCYLKVLVNATNHRVVGLHYLGPNAGEVIMGYAVAFRMKMTIEDLQSTIGIHPTCSEEFTLVNITKRSGLSPEKTGC